jgi:hypothetical protein
MALSTAWAGCTPCIGCAWSSGSSSTWAPATGIALVRDIGYRAMRALVAQDGAGGYTLYATEGGAAMTGAVDPTPLDPGNSGIPFLRYTLTVAVMQKEVV